MSWNHRGGRSDWEGNNYQDSNNSYQEKDNWSWPNPNDDHQGDSRGNRHDRTPRGGRGGGRGNESGGRGHEGGYRDSPRTTDHRTQRDRNNQGGKWKHDKFSDESYGRGGGGMGYRPRDRHDSDSRDHNREYNRDQGRDYSRDDRPKTYDRRDNWAKGGSWGNVRDNRDRSRSPPRYNDRREDDRRYESSRDDNRQEKFADRSQHRGSYKSQQEDSKWPTRNFNEPPRNHRETPRNQNYSNQRTHEPKTTLVVKGVPQGMPADKIRVELEKMDLYVRTCQLAPTREPGEWSGVGYIEMGRVPDASYIVDQCKGQINVDGYPLQVDYADTSSLLQHKTGGGRDYTQNTNSHGQISHSHSHAQVAQYNHGGVSNSKFPTEPTDTMIVRNLDLNSTEKSISDAFGYITKKTILDIRLAKDRQTGHSRGFAFITWSSVADCKQVLEYLQKATPKFNIDGTVVVLDYANGLPNKQHQIDLKVKAANNAIAAAQSIKKSWEDPNQLTNGKAGLMKQTASDQGIAPHMTPHLYPSLPADIGSRAPPTGMIPPIPPDQIPPLTDADGRYRKYPNPNYAMFQWFNQQQMYYDPCTGLMWDQNSQYFYNQYKQIYLYWDETQDTFVPVQNQVNHKPVANPIQQLPGKVTNEITGKKAKASDIQKQMDSWMKQNTKKRDKPMNKEEADALRKQKKLAGAAAGSFATGSFGSTFQTKTAIPSEPAPLPTGLPHGSIPPPPSGPPGSMNFGAPTSFGPSAPKHEDTDMFKEEQTGFADLKPKLESKIEKHEKTESDDDEYLDWKNFKCLLCRRAFTNQSQLAKHVEKSKLHRENLDKAKHPPPGSDEEPEEESDAYRAVMQIESAMGTNYRDRAKERRNKFGEDLPPGMDDKYDKYQDDYTGPVEQPTKHGIGSDNKGAQLLQKMGWTGGTGLGKHRQGIVNPIEAGSVRENKTAGLGTKATTRQTPRSGKGEQYKQKIRQLTQDRWNDAGHG